MGSVYAILRNGMWDDPAEALTGSIAQSFERKVLSHGLTKRVAPYFTWRFCYLVCCTTFCIGQLSLDRLLMRSSHEKYSDFLGKQLPPTSSLDRFADFLTMLDASDWALWIASLISFVLVCTATVLARPACCVVAARTSQMCIRWAWLVTFVPPFLMFLLVPLRSFVDWNGVVADACNSSISQIFRLPGSSLQTTLKAFSSTGLLDAGIQGVLESDTWCASKGADWHKAFFNNTVSCVWSIEDVCREHVCSQVDADASSCLLDCIPFLLSHGSMAVNPLETPFPNFIEALSGVLHAASENCVKGVKPFRLGSPPPLPGKGVAKAFSLASPPALPDKDVAKASSWQLFNVMLYGQRLGIVHLSEAITAASVQSEFVVGLLISLVVGKHLVCSALSVLGGLAESLVNAKAVFPGSQLGGWVLILTTFEVAPVYAALLAVFQQLGGDELSAIAGVLALLFLAMGILTGQRILKLRDSDRQLLYKRVCMEYALKTVFGFGVVAALIAWTFRKNWHDFIAKYVHQNFLTPQVVVASLANILSKKILVAIAGTDAILNALVQSERWHATMPDSERAAHDACVVEYQLMMTGSTCNRKSTSASPSSIPNSPACHPSSIPNFFNNGAPPNSPACRPGSLSHSSTGEFSLYALTV